LLERGPDGTGAQGSGGKQSKRCKTPAESHDRGFHEKL
jgi:hypothetical protein